MRSTRLTALVATILAMAWTLPAAAQAYPQKPVRIVVPWPAGGGVDTVARTVAQKLTEAMGQTFLVENRVGATGTIGADHVAKSAPDGYTLMASSPPLIYTATLFPKLPYEPLRDFAPVSMMVAMPFYFVAHPSLPVKSVKELVALAKAQPGRLTIASSGNGSGAHLVGALFQRDTGIELLHVPYKGTAPALSDTIGGQTTLMFSDPSAVNLIRSGRLRVLAVSTLKRSNALPEVPTLAEAGVKGFDVWNWYPMLSPAGVPRDIIQKLNTEIVRILQHTDAKDRLAGQGLDPSVSTPQELGALMKREHDTWGPLIKAAGIKAD